MDRATLDRHRAAAIAAARRDACPHCGLWLDRAERYGWPLTLETLCDVHTDAEALAVARRTPGTPERKTDYLAVRVDKMSTHQAARAVAAALRKADRLATQARGARGVVIDSKQLALALSAEAEAREIVRLYLDRISHDSVLRLQARRVLSGVVTQVQRQRDAEAAARV